MPCPDENELLDLGRGLLDGERADEIARHLDLCDLCRALAAEATGGSVRTPPLGEAAADDDELDPPEMFPKLGRYVVLDLVSAGGMGVVYEAFDPRLDRKVALKVLRPESLGAETLDQAQARLLREAQAMASLSHPNVVPVFDVGTVGRQVFVAMELVDGGTLTDWLRAERRGWREIVEMYLQAGRGLAAAHAAGIVHRDFKPDNVLVGRDGRARVSDFGLARPAVRELARVGADRGAGAHESSAALVGTPAYMAPEQFEGSGVSARSDQFSFCVALWEALYGRRPFPGQSAEQLAESVLSGAPPVPPAGSSVPGWLQRAVQRGLSRRPEERFPFIEGLLDDLSRSSLEGRRRRRLAAAAVALFIALAAASIQLARHLAQRCEGVGAEIASVWNPARREALREAFAGANVPYSSGSLRTIEAALDRFATDWSEQRRAACELAGEEAPQLPCLRRQLVDLRAVLERLESADRAAVESGASAAGRLAFEAACGGAREESAEGPLEVLESLARTEAVLLTGAAEDALALAKQSHALAADAGDPALEARALIGLAAAQAEGGDFAAAEESALAATTLTESAGLPALAARAWGQLVFVTGLQPGRAAEAARLARHAFAFLEAAGGDAATEARLLSLVGKLALLQGDHERAAGAFEREKALRSRAGVEADPALAEVHADLARARLASGRGKAEAVEHAAQAVRIGERALGAAHPWVGRWLLVLGEARLAAGRDDEALQAFARASTVFGQNEGARWRAPWALIGQARALRGADQAQEALERLEQAQSIARAYPGRSPALEAELPLARGEVLLRGRRFEQALESFERARALAAEVAPARLAAAGLGIGRVHLEAGAPAKAVEPLEAAKRQGLETGAAELAEIELALARALELSGAGKREPPAVTPRGVPSEVPARREAPFAGAR